MYKAKFWVTSSTLADFENLKIQPNDSYEAKPENCESCLWFTEDEEKEAKDFLVGMKRWILDNYPHKERLTWLNKEWVKK